MKLKNLEAYIDTIIVMRGKSYFSDGLVEELEETEPEFWQACVQGSGEYDIEIDLSGDEVDQWSCTCPYDRGPVCKHVVATLLAVREKKQGGIAEEDTGSVDKPLSQSDQLDHVLANLDRKELEQELRDLLMQESYSLECFLLRFQQATGSSAALSERYRELFGTIVDKHSERYGFIDYRAAWDFTNEVSGLLSTLIDSNAAAADQVSCCFSIIEGLIRDVLEAIDDSDGGTGIIISQIRDILEGAYPDLSPAQQQDCFQRALKYHYGGLDDYGLELSTLLAEWSEGNSDYQALYLQEMDRQITQKANSWSRDHALCTKYQLLLQWEHLDDATNLAMQYMEIAEFRKHFVQQAIDSEAFDKARQLIHEGIAIAEEKHHPGSVSSWREMLLAVAEQTNDLPAIRKELLSLMAGFRFRMELYQRYKATYTSEEWVTAHHDVYEQLKTNNAPVETLAEVLDDENELEALFRLIREQKHGAIALFKRYATRLASTFPEEAVATYRRAIHTDMESVGRKTYEQAVRDMQILEALPGGQEAVQQLLAELRQLYKNRKAMLEVFRMAFG